MLYTIEVLKSFDVLDYVTKFEDFRGKGPEMCLVDIFRNVEGSSWFSDEEKQKLVGKIKEEDGKLTLRGSNFAVRITESKELI